MKQIMQYFVIIWELPENYLIIQARKIDYPHVNVGHTDMDWQQTQWNKSLYIL
jgi:hypothetical protein